MYAVREIERWIDDIDAATKRRIETVVRALSAEPDVRRSVLARDDAKERAFAALLTGDFEYLREREPSWSSWVEGDPPYLLLLMNDGVLVDLTEQRTGLAGFSETYGCSPSQLARLVRHRPAERPGPIMINVRNDDIRSYTEDGARDLVGPILALCQEFPDRFYRLAQIRRAGFELFGIDYDAFEARGRMLASRLPAQMQAPKPDAHMRLITRNATWPNTNQVGSRIGYYLIAKELWGKAAIDPLLENWIGQGDTPIEFGAAMDPSLPLARLYVRHHVFTAPLTGAMGSQYTMREREANAIYLTFGTSDDDDPQLAKAIRHHAGSGRIGLASWMFDKISGAADDGTNDLNASRGPLRRYPVDEEWRQFLGRVDSNRLELVAHGAANVKEVEIQLGKLEERFKSNDYSPTEEAELVRLAFSAGLRGGFSGLNFLSAIRHVGDPAGELMAGTGIMCKSVIKALEFIKDSMRVYGLGEKIVDRWSRRLDTLCQRRTASAMIVRFEGMLDRPRRLRP